MDRVEKGEKGERGGERRGAKQARDQTMNRASKRGCIFLSKSAEGSQVLCSSRTHTVPLPCRCPLCLHWPAAFYCLRLCSLLSLSLSLDDVIESISPALASCFQTVLAKTHLPEPSSSHTFTLNTALICPE